MNCIEIILDLTRSKEERAQAAFQLAASTSEDKDSLDAIIQAMLTDPSPIVRHECAFILGDTGLDYVAKYLIEVLERDLSNIVKHEALSALGSLGNAHYIPVIERYLNHPDVIVNETAEMAVERIQRYNGGVCFR